MPRYQVKVRPHIAELVSEILEDDEVPFEVSFGKNLMTDEVDYVNISVRLRDELELRKAVQQAGDEHLRSQRRSRRSR